MAASADTQVTFQVDMSVPIAAGTFKPASEFVWAQGSFNGWGQLNLSPSAGNTNVYVGTADDTTDANGGLLSYKFGDTQNNYENTADGNNRTAALPATSGASLALPYTYFNDAGPGITNLVKFQVDMSEQIYLGTWKAASNQVEVRGNFNSWSGGSTLTNNPLVLTTNAQGVVNSNVYQLILPIVNCTNAANDYKYVMQPGTGWENVSGANADGGGNRWFINSSNQTLPVVSFGDAALSFPLVTFQVDMTEQVVGGTFVPGTDTVSAHGTFNGWGAGINLTNNPAAANTNLYTGTTFDPADPNGGVLIYKYVQDTTYENTTAADNRCAQLPAGGGSLLLPVPFYADAGPGITANVTFQVDMAEQVHVGVFDTNAGSTVEVRGNFQGWSGGSTLTNDPTIMTTNATGVVTSNVYVGTFEMTGSTNGTEEFKYVMQPGTAYENPSASDSDRDNNNNRFFGITTQTLPIVSFGDEALVFNTVTNDVTFIIDMSVQEYVSAFTATNTIEIHGDFNGWGSGTTMANTNPLATNLYYTTIQYVAPAGQQRYFKYVIQPGSQWENVAAANSIGGNRWLNLPGTSGAIDNGPVYFSDEGPASLVDFITVTNCMVTFTVDMTPALTGTYNNGGPFVLGTDNVYLNGINGGVDNSYWKWSALSPPPQYAMTEITNGPLYTITVPVNAGQPLDLTYKYGIDGQDNEAPSGANHSRYVRSLPDYTMPTDVFGSQGTNLSTEIAFGDLTASHSGNQVVLSWLGRTGVRLQTTSSLNPGAVWTDQYLTDGTNLIVAPGGMASTNYTIGAANVFYRLVGPH